MTPSPSSQEEARELPTLDEVHAFLLGTGSINGLWFGDDDSGRPYWWRKFLREALAARPTPDLGDVDELVEAAKTFEDLLNYAIMHSGLVENDNEAKQSPLVTRAKKSIAIIEQLHAATPAVER